jgi:hypothetical protein
MDVSVVIALEARRSLFWPMEHLGGRAMSQMSKTATNHSRELLVGPLTDLPPPTSLQSALEACHPAEKLDESKPQFKVAMDESKRRKTNHPVNHLASRMSYEGQAAQTLNQ